jgi:protease I
MAGALEGKRVAFLMANEGVEQVELTEPWKAVQHAGGEPVLLAPEPGEVQAFNHLDKADRFAVNRIVADVDAEEFDALVLPGGVANPDQLRIKPPAVHFVHRMAETGRPIAVICHGPWTLIDAGLVSGRRFTSWPSLRTDLTNAGAEWVDEVVVVDTNGPNTIVSSRKPDDLPRFCEELVHTFSQAFART